jgi:hypothetical protein
MKLSIVLPLFPSRPGGGCKIMFEYANNLIRRGYSVSLYYSMQTSYSQYKYPLFMRMIVFKLLHPTAKPKWFSLNKNIKTRI